MTATGRVNETAVMQGFQRRDGRKGIRNYVLVAYLVECAHHVARAIVAPYDEQGAQIIGFPGCYPNAYAQDMMEALCTHPNVGAVLLVSLGCEQMNRPTQAARCDRAFRPPGIAAGHSKKRRDAGVDHEGACLGQSGDQQSRFDAANIALACRSGHRH